LFTIFGNNPLKEFAIHVPLYQQVQIPPGRYF